MAAGLSVCCCTALFLLALVVPARATEKREVDIGHRLAQTWCSSCHVVDRAQKEGSSTGAPPFEAIAESPNVTPDMLHAFLQVPHARMPDLHLTRREIDVLTAYILSLR